jgi:hypothetical protein
MRGSEQCETASTSTTQKEHEVDQNAFRELIQGA